jgi:pimeloyl-ACP methyl ester carboxylesterase
MTAISQIHAAIRSLRPFDPPSGLRTIRLMTQTERSLTLPDGRSLGYAEWGDPDGSPVMVIHGTPGCRLNRHPSNELMASTGARVITYDRAGYGISDRHRGRTVNDCVSDITALVDALGIGGFAVTGGSGGGPHCLAVAAALPDRVTRAACVVGVAPYDALGADAWYDGMDPENVKEFGWALAGEDVLHAELTVAQREAEERVAEDPSTLLGDFDLPEADKAILARADIQQVIREAIPEQARNGVWGWVDDDLAFTRPWGFDPATIRVPTAVWWGAEDVLVPAAHGEWIARTVPGALPRVDRTGGHLADPDTEFVLLSRWLVDGTPWPEPQ